MFEDLDEASRLVDNWQQRLEEQASRARALSARVAGLTARASSSGGLVEVTVSGQGLMTGLWMDDAIRRQPAADTAASVLAALRAAQAALAARVADAVAETVGIDSPAGRAVLASYGSSLRGPSDAAS